MSTRSRRERVVVSVRLQVVVVRLEAVVGKRLEVSVIEKPKVVVVLGVSRKVVISLLFLLVGLVAIVAFAALIPFINPALIIYSFSQFQIRFMVEHLGVLGVACIQLQILLLPHVGASSNLTFSITLHIGPRAFVTMAAAEQAVGREVDPKRGVKRVSQTLRILERH